MCGNKIKKIAQKLQNRNFDRIKAEESNINAAVMMILNQFSDVTSALFIQRSLNDKDVFSGHMAFPGGKKKKDDLNLYDTACRETFEEIGIDIKEDSMFLGQLDDCKPNNPAARKFIVTPFVSCLTRDIKLKIDDTEVADFVWIPLIELYEQYKNNLDKFGEGYNHKKFEFYYNEYFIWGLTGRILNQFFNLTGIFY